MTISVRARGMRTRLLLSACFVAAPGVAYAQDVVVAPPTTRTTVVNMDATDTLTVAAGGTLRVSGTRAVAITGTSTGSGIVITNNGTIEGVADSATNGRGISGTIAVADRTATITNSGTIRASNDAIQFGGGTTDIGTIRITNSGTIVSTGASGTAGIGQAAQGVEIAAPATTLILNNLQGGTITGNQGIQTSANSTITNAGTITGTGAVVTVAGDPPLSATQGEGVRGQVGATLVLTNEATGVITGVYGVIGTGNNTIVNRGTISGGEGGLATSSLSREAIRVNLGTLSTINSVTLAAGSTTSAGTGNGASGNAVVFGGSPVSPTVNTLNIETGATINGGIAGAGNSFATDILNLTGTGSQTLVSAANFDALNVTGGIWGIVNTQNLRNGATIAAGATLRYDDADATTGGSVAGTIVNNGTLIDNRTSTVTSTGAISGTGGLQIANTGSMVLTTANTYSGDTLIRSGRLRTGLLTNAFSANSAVTVSGTGILDLNGVDGAGSDTQTGYDQTIANLSGDGSVRTGTLAGAILTTGSAGGDTSFSGVISQLGGLTKVGTGTLTLSGSNTAAGMLSINGGGVALSGRWAGATTMAAGTRLSGAGRIAGILTASEATIAPGNNGIGTLTTGGLILSGGSVLNYDLGAPGTGDRIDVNGDLVLDGTLNINNIGGFGEGVYRLLNYTGALTNNGLVVGTVPAGSNPGIMAVQTSVATQVNLVYGTPASNAIQFWDGADITGNGVVDGGSGSWTNNFPNWTNSNGTSNTAWEGGFAVFQGAAGTVTVDAPLVFTGAQFITDGYVIAPGSGTLTTSTAQTNLRADPGVTATIAAGIRGSGGIVKNDTGTLILAGANTYGGVTNIQGGTLAVLGGSAIPTTSNVTIAAGGTLDIRAAQAIGGLNGVGSVLLSGGGLTTGALNGTDAFSGSISGVGGLTHVGTGTLTLTGYNTYTGGTLVDAGTLRLDGNVAGAVNVSNGAALSGTGSAGGVVTIANGGTLSPGGAGAGTLTTGGLVLSSGSLLDFGLGAPNVAGASDRIQVNGNLTLDGILNVTDLGGFGAGVYRLIDYTGALTDNGLTVGTLPGNADATQVTVQTSVGSQVNLVYDNVIPEVQFWDGANTVANGAIDGGTGSWTNTVTNWTDAAGTRNSRWGGRFAVFQGTAGTVTVNDAIAFTGMQFVTNGYTIAAGTGALNATEAQSNIRVDPGVTATIGATIGGVGGLNKLDTGTLILTGVNTYAGATTVAGGTLRAGATGALPGGTAVTVATGATLDLTTSQTIASLAGTGSVTLTGGNLTTGGGNTDTRFAGVISGSGVLTKAGTGIFTLAGANSYIGGTAVNAGTLRLDGGTVGSGALTVASGAVFDVNNGNASVGALSGAGNITLGSGRLTTGGTATSAYSGVISGSGGLTKTGTGTLTLSGANTYSGGTIVNGGVLTAGAANVFGTGTLTVTAPGSVSLGTFIQTVGGLSGDGAINLGTAALSVNGAGSTTYSGVMSGAGRLTKLGTGTLTLGGANTFTGATTVTEGLLVVNGSLAGAVSVGTAGRLGGSGRIGALTVGGVVAPGNSIGTLNVTGALTFASGSTYQVEIAPNGTTDLIAATGAVTINGGTVQVLGGGQTGFAPLTTYTIVTGLSVTGAFAGVTSDLAFLAPSLVYNQTSVQLRMLRNDVNLTAVAQTPNQQAVAAAVATRNSGGVFDAVVGLNAGDARGAYDQLSGEVFTGSVTIAQRDGHDAARGMLARVDGPRGKKVAVWVGGDLDQTTIAAQDGFGRIKSERQEVKGGIEYTLDQFRAGAAYRYAKNDITLNRRGSNADLTSKGAYGYASYAMNGFRAAGGAGIAELTLETNRQLQFGSLNNALQSEGTGRSVTGFGEIAYLMPLSDGVKVGPYAGASVTSVTFNRVQEFGGAAALVVNRTKQTSTLANYGVRGTGVFGGVTLSADVGGRSYLGDAGQKRSFAFVDTGAGFSAGASEYGKTTVAGQLDASVPVGRFLLGLGVRGETAGHVSNYGVRASAGFRF